MFRNFFVVILVVSGPGAAAPLGASTPKRLTASNWRDRIVEDNSSLQCR
jgi:hypothetical protein